MIGDTALPLGHSVRGYWVTMSTRIDVYGDISGKITELEMLLITAYLVSTRKEKANEVYTIIMNIFYHNCTLCLIESSREPS